MVRVWDMRKMGCKFQLPSHSQPISQVRYSKGGAMLLTASFDGVVKVYSTVVGSGDINMACYSKVTSLRGHSGKVMAADFSPGKTLSSALASTEQSSYGPVRRIKYTSSYLSVLLKNVEWCHY